MSTTAYGSRAAGGGWFGWLAETIVFSFFVVLVVYIIGGLFKLVFGPVTWLWKSDEELDNGKSKQRAVDALRARSAVRERYAADRCDPLNGYLDRFVEHPGEYLGDPSNETYQQWYNRFSRGELLDSTMRWAPEVYDDNHRVCAPFLRYLEVQTDMHRRHPVHAARFLATIRRYYPEFEPSFRGIRNAIEALRSRAADESLRAQAGEQLSLDGVPEGVIRALESLTLPSEEMQERIERAREWVRSGYDEEVVRVMAANGVQDEGVVEQGAILHSISVDPQLAVDKLNGELSADDLRRIEEYAVNTREILGEASYAPSREEPARTLIEVMIEREVRGVKLAHRRSLRDAAWRQA